MALSVVAPSKASASWWNPFTWFRPKTVAEFNAKNRINGEINGTPIVAEIGGIQTYKVDMVISPMPPSGEADGLSYYIEKEGGNQRAFEAFSAELKSSGNLPAQMGTVLLHEAGGSAKYVANIVVLGAQQQETFLLIRNSVYKALMLASQKPDIKTVAIPTIGSGVSGSLTEAQVAAALTSAVAMATSQGAKFEKIIFPIFREIGMFGAYNLMLEPIAKGSTARGYEAFMPGGAQSPEKGHIHYDWAGTSSSFNQGVRVEKVGSIGELEVKVFAPYSMGGVTHVYAITDVEKLTGQVEHMGGNVYLRTRRIESNSYRNGYYLEHTLYYKVTTAVNTVPSAHATERIMYEIIKATEGKIQSIGFSFTNDFVGIDLRDKPEARAGVIEGVLNTVHRLKEENVNVSQISILLDPSLPGSVDALRGFKRAVDTYAVAHLKLYNERIGYKSPAVCKAGL